jgi:uncharacterized protein
MVQKKKAACVGKLSPMFNPFDKKRICPATVHHKRMRNKSFTVFSFFYIFRERKNKKVPGFDLEIARSLRYTGSMKTLIATDIHGDKELYIDQLRLAVDKKADCVINTGDYLPLPDEYKIQMEFLDTFFYDYLSEFDSIRKHFIFIPGNHDIDHFDRALVEYCRKSKYLHYLPGTRAKVDGLEFIGYGNVVDTFGIRNRCRLDIPEDKPLTEQEARIIEDNGKSRLIYNWNGYIKSLPTIKQELEQLPKPDNMKKAIYLSHMPPAYLGLDIVHNRYGVGSLSLHAFLEKNQPHMSVHGHIHESPRMTGRWFNSIKNTMCVQVGLSDPELSYAVIDLADRKIIESHVCWIDKEQHPQIEQ